MIPKIDRLPEGYVGKVMQSLLLKAVTHRSEGYNELKKTIEQTRGNMLLPFRVIHSSTEDPSKTRFVS